MSEWSGAGVAAAMPTRGLTSPRHRLLVWNAEMAPEDPYGAPSEPAAALLLELTSAYGDLRECVIELEQLLSKPNFDRARLTSIRLRIAELRLARGHLVGKIAAYLAGKVSESQAAQLREFCENHEAMLRAAAAHTNKWPLDAIDANWTEYRTVTAEITRLDG